MMLTGARAHFCASHTLPEHPNVHGHSYEVWAYTGLPVNAEEWQADLVKVCRELDHKLLDGIIDPPTMEKIADWISDRMNAIKVKIVRPVEGLSAEYHRG